MQTELEAKFIDIDRAAIRDRLKKLGAKLIAPERLMRRRNYDYPDLRLEKERAGWIRVRDEGNKITLAYKQLDNRGLHGTKEVMIGVNNFDTTCLLLETIGFKQTSYQETKRESWQLAGADIEIDEWPWIPPFLEIEAPDEPTLKSLAEKLGFDFKKALHGSVEIVYQQYYKVTDQDVDRWPNITFSPVPEDLMAKQLWRS